jgi:hypothetical protein
MFPSMAIIGGGVLAMWWDTDPGGDDDMNQWHFAEHFPERVGLPGFLRGRRFTSCHGHPTYFTLYEGESVEVFASPAYVERLNNPTEWTRRALRSFRHTSRTACRVSFTQGAVDGGWASTIEIEPAATDVDRVRSWITQEALPAALRLPGVVSATFCEPDYERTGVDTAEKNLRSQPDRMASWLVVLEGISSQHLWRAPRDLLGTAAIRHAGGAGHGEFGVFQFAFGLSKRGV